MAGLFEGSWKEEELKRRRNEKTIEGSEEMETVLSRPLTLLAKKGRERKEVNK